MNKQTIQEISNQSQIQSLQNNVSQKFLGSSKKELQVSKTQNRSTTQQGQPKEQNCIFNICYNGEARQFALGGQLLAAGEEFDDLPPLE
jgi:hypothetical protein